jgi:hypothetical protein
MLRRNNRFDLDYGDLTGVKFNGLEYTYINNNMVGDGLLWNGSTLTGPAYINCFAFGITGTTSIATQSVWYKLQIVTTEGYKRDGFSHSSNRITNNGDTRIVKAEAIISLSSGNNNVIHLAFYKNGDTLVPCSEQDITTSSGGRAGNISIQCLVEMENGDFIEIWTKNTSGTSNIITSQYNFIVTEL